MTDKRGLRCPMGQVQSLVAYVKEFGIPMNDADQFEVWNDGSVAITMLDGRRIELSPARPPAQSQTVDA